MKIRVACSLIFLAGAAALAGCGFLEHQERDAWRGQAEQACLAGRIVKPTKFIRPIAELEGPGTCGVENPFRVFAIADGSVGVQPSARIGCPMTAALETWMRDTVQPAARARFGSEVAEIRNTASYDCRTRNNKPGATLSEHAFGNGLDIGGFTLVDGRQIAVPADARTATPEAQAFLSEVMAGACGVFKTVLGPGADGRHETHIHLDLAHHDLTGERTYCRPRPSLPGKAAPPSGAGDLLMSYAPGGRDADIPTGSVGGPDAAHEDAPADYEPDE